MCSSEQDAGYRMASRAQLTKQKAAFDLRTSVGHVSAVVCWPRRLAGCEPHLLGNYIDGCLDGVQRRVGDHSGHAELNADVEKRVLHKQEAATITAGRY